LHGWNDRVMGAALDLPGDVVAAIRQAMQGLVLDGDRLTGWDKRQKASDNVADRVRKHRSRKADPAPNGSGGGGTGGAEPEYDNGRCNGDVTLQEAGCNVTVTQKPLSLTLSLTDSSDESVGDDDAGAPATPPHVEIGRRVAALAGIPPSRWPRLDLPTVAGWLEKGADPERDIFPVVATVLHRAGAVEIHWLAYFTRAIEAAIRTRTAPLPEGKPSHARRPVRSAAEETHLRRKALFDDYHDDLDRKRAGAG
jgi:hypothetical protein